MRSRLVVAVFAFVLTGVIASCEDNITSVGEGFDQTATWRANLNAANEVQTPAVSSPATGRAWFVDNNTTITWYMEYNNLVANPSGAHIHRGAAGVNGDIMVSLDFVSGQRSGVVSGTIDMTVADVSNEAGVQPPGELRTLLNTGGAYVNVHSTTYPAGEIRGQVVRR
jgi:hypothetical protein